MAQWIFDNPGYTCIIAVVLLISTCSCIEDISSSFAAWSRRKEKKAKKPKKYMASFIGLTPTGYIVGECLISTPKLKIETIDQMRASFMSINPTVVSATLLSITELEYEDRD